MKIKESLRRKLAEHMIRAGKVTRDETHDNPMTCARQVDLIWRNRAFTITEIDGAICRIDAV